MAKVTFNEERCKGCGLCITACPKKIIHFSDTINGKGFKPAVVTEMDACIGCASCALMCPDCVIEVER